MNQSGNNMKHLLRFLCTLALVCLCRGTLTTTASAQQVTQQPIAEPVFMCGSGVAGQRHDKQRIFESVPTRPLAVSDDGRLLFVINTPANCLEIFEIGERVLTLRSTVSVGIDPVAVAQRTATELWVVNHVSDSISIVRIDGAPRVAATLQVGDAPWDVVFADHGRDRRGATHNRRNRAFVSAAFRGQHHPQFKTSFLLQNRLDAKNSERGEQIGRADLWAIDIGANTGDTEVAGVINLFTDSVRSLAVNRDGSQVFATAFKSGNRTAAVAVPFDALIGEKWSADGVGHPEPMLMVQQNDKGEWRDLLGRDWSQKLNFSIADNDLFIINAGSALQLGNLSAPKFNRHAVATTVKNLGTILFNTVYDARHNRLIVSGLESHNTQPMQDKLKERFVSNQLTVVDLNRKPAPGVHRINLDGREFQSARVTPGMALPGALHLDRDGDQILVASMGGNKLSQFKLSTDAGKPLQASGLKQQFLGKARDYGAAPAGGPVGFATDPMDRLLFVYTLFDNKILTYRITSTALDKISEYTMFSPEALDVRQGRQWLYDATLTSSNGAVACASCHVFGGSDKLQWDLSQKDKPLEIVELGYVAHPGREIPDLKTEIRAITFKQDPAAVKTGDRLPLGNTRVPVVFMGSKKAFAEALQKNTIDLKSPGLAYLEKGDADPRLFKYRGTFTTQPAWLLIDTPFFHPLKGPMLTLPLHGLTNSGALHFRGDMQGSAPGGGNHCPKGRSVEERALKEFNTPCDGSPGTFEGLMGGQRLSEQDMDALTRYVFALSYPPNPIRPLNNRVNSAGEKIFTAQKIAVDVTDFAKVLNKGPLIFTCAECHTTDRDADRFGTSKMMYSAPALTLQDAKIPHLRFLYDRAGFFRGDYRKANALVKQEGMVAKLRRAMYANFGFYKAEFDSAPRYLAVQPLDYYDELIHAIGYNHGAWFDSTMFATSAVWILNGEDPRRQTEETLRRYENLYEYLMAFDTDYFPMYGQQFTFRASDLSAIKSRTVGSAALLDKFRGFVDSIYSPEGHKGVQCHLSYYTTTATGRWQKIAIKSKNNLDTGNGESLARALLSLTPQLKPITFTCS